METDSVSTYIELPLVERFFSWKKELFISMSLTLDT